MQALMNFFSLKVKRRKKKKKKDETRNEEEEEAMEMRKEEVSPPFNEQLVSLIMVPGKHAAGVHLLQERQTAVLDAIHVPTR